MWPMFTFFSVLIINGTNQDVFYCKGKFVWREEGRITKKVPLSWLSSGCQRGWGKTRKEKQIGKREIKEDWTQGGGWGGGDSAYGGRTYCSIFTNTNPCRSLSKRRERGRDWVKDMYRKREKPSKKANMSNPAQQLPLPTEHESRLSFSSSLCQVGGSRSFASRNGSRSLKPLAFSSSLSRHFPFLFFSYLTSFFCTTL